MGEVPATASRLSVRSRDVEVTFEDVTEHGGDPHGVRTVLRSGQFHEQALLEHVRSLDLKGVYVDVGGFIGNHALYFAMLCPSAQVVTFEPRPGPRAELVRNVAANRQQAKIAVQPTGVAERRRMVTLDGDTFECAALDAVVDREVSVIRLDLEGLELEALGGAARILKHDRPAVFARVRERSRRQELEQRLGELGYLPTGRVFNSTYEFVVPVELSDELRRAYRSLAEVNDELAAAQATAKTIQQRYREATSRLKTLDTELARLRSEMLINVRRLHKHQTQEERLRQELRVAHQKEPNTLSFQLGNALIRATKSRRDLMALPSRLFALRDNARERRERSGAGARAVAEGGLLSIYKPPPRAEARPKTVFPAPASLAQHELDPGARLAKLRVAAIMDEFTAASFGPECKIHHLRPTAWKRELPEFAPELLFVESAWRGADGLWANKVGTDVSELSEIVQWCRAEGVPTVFWNKEDPVHFAGFANTANLFDFVFTTDIDCVHRYRQLLGHDRVFVLPFAAQPAVHNPIEKYERKAGLCFAGAYYARYPERQADFLAMLGELQLRWPIDIYDRNFGDPNPDFKFPEMFRHLIRGKLPFEQIDRAYKGYELAINLNSIKSSQTMFARRVFELLASNTVTVSNFSRGVRLLLGDLVIATDDPQQHSRRLDEITRTRASLRRFRLAGLRKVLLEHTYQDRLADVVQRVFELPPLRLLPEITVVGVARTEAEAAAVRTAFAAQRYPHKRLVMLGDLPPAARLIDHTGSRIATFVPTDYYGPTYLLDLALATRYWRGGVGKVAHHAWHGEVELVNDGAQYHPASALRARQALLVAASLPAISVAEMLETADRLEVRGEDLLAIDEFGYCRDGATRAVAEVVDDLPGLDTGLPLGEVLAVAETIPEPSGQDDDQRALGAEGLEALFKAAPTGSIDISHFKGMVLSSSLAEGERYYLYARRDFTLAQLGFARTGRLFLDVTPGLNLQMILTFLDAAGEKVEHLSLAPQTNHEFEIPARAAAVRLGFRISGPGLTTVRAVVFGNVSSSEPTRVFGRHDVLVLTNHYPAADDLYRNGFVHRRLVDYRARGLRADVCCLQPNTALRYNEFEGIDVVRGGKAILEGMLALRRHRAVLVHFLDEAMWKLLEPHLDELVVIVWVHGSEIQPWHRRKFDIANDLELSQAKAASEVRMKFWRAVLAKPHPNFKLVFVSQYFADEVQQDVGIQLPRTSYEIIHNLIDTELFSYEPKPVEQRKKILTIRPFASRKYANDLSVEAIVKLSTEPWFGELEVRVIGDGRLFDETVAPLRKFDNVIVERGFLTQAEIAALHKDYGVFLSPTRMDAQGVSRDEAMSSGLVPVTTDVAAIPEFVDSTCGFLAPLDDAAGLAAGIAALYHDPARFARMSAAAAARVRGQSGPEQTTGRELALIRAAIGRTA